MLQKSLQVKLKSSFTKWQFSSFKLRVQHLCLLPNILHFPLYFKCSAKTLPEASDATFCKSEVLQYYFRVKSVQLESNYVNPTTVRSSYPPREAESHFARLLNSTDLAPALLFSRLWLPLRKEMSRSRQAEFLWHSKRKTGAVGALGMLNTFLQ